ncbi:MAG: hypothetical protein U0228_08550 [Myxococcaceae bacterium]
MLLAVVLLAGTRASAQACCAGASLLSPARLTPHEDALVGVDVKGSLQAGSLDARGVFAGNASGSGALDGVLTLHHTMRLGESGQLTWSLPLDVGARWVPGLSEGAVSLGDLVVSARHDFLLAGESASRPGSALLFSVTAPTGVPPEQSHLPLGADAVGTGAWQLSVGGAVEQRFGSLTLQGMALAHGKLPRTVGAVTQVFGPGLSLGAAVAWTFESELALALSLASSGTLPSWLTDEGGALRWRPDTARWRNSLSFALATPIDDRWRLQAAVSGTLPFGFNELGAVTLSVLLMRTWS